jgi:hypothetical protein
MAVYKSPLHLKLPNQTEPLSSYNLIFEAEALVDPSTMERGPLADLRTSTTMP